MSNRAERRSYQLVLLGLFLASLTLRPQLLAIGPLLPLIQDDLGVSHAIGGLLVTIPIFCMAVAPLLAPMISDSAGLRLGVTASIGLLAATGLIRAALPGAVEILFATLFVGLGLGLVGSLLPLMVKEHLARRPAAGTGIYSAGMQLGASLSTAAAVPVAYLLGGWREALAAFSIFIAVIAVLCAILFPPDLHGRSRAIRLPALPWREGFIWAIVLLFALRSFIYQGLNAWLPALYVEHGWTAAEAGALVAVEVGLGFPTALAVSRWADRVASRRGFLVLGSLGLLISTAGIAFAPDFGWLWAVILGVGMGVLFPITMTLPLDVATTRSEVAGATALVLGAGYLISAASPFLLGVIRDAVGSFEPVMLLLILLSCCSLAVSALLREANARRRAAGASSTP